MRLGSFQIEALEACLHGAHNPIKDLKGRAKNWTSRYYSSLHTLQERGLLESSPGPRGGRAWITTEKGVNALKAV